MKEYIERETVVQALYSVLAPTPSESYILSKCIGVVRSLPRASIGKDLCEAVDNFKEALLKTFINMCCGNDYNKVNLLQIGDTIDSIFEAHIAEILKKYTERSENGK